MIHQELPQLLKMTSEEAFRLFGGTPSHLVCGGKDRSVLGALHRAQRSTANPRMLQFPNSSSHTGQHGETESSTIFSVVEGKGKERLQQRIANTRTGGSYLNRVETRYKRGAWKFLGKRIPRSDGMFEKWPGPAWEFPAGRCSSGCGGGALPPSE